MIFESAVKKRLPKGTKAIVEGEQVAAPETHQLDSGTQGLLDAQKQRAAMSGADILAEKMAGTENIGGLVNQAPIQQQNNALGMTTPGGMTQALQERSSKYFDTQMGRTKTGAKAAASKDRFNRNNVAMNYSMVVAQQEQEQARRLNQHEKNLQAARDSALGSILGIGGTILGAGAGFLAGGPAGAAAGAKIGGSIGGAAGGDAQEQEI